MVERSLSMREVRGSMPLSSNFSILTILIPSIFKQTTQFEFLPP